MHAESVMIPQIKVRADLSIPLNSRSIVIFVHGSGNNRLSVRNKIISDYYNEHGIATLLVDLLTEQEKHEDIVKEHLRYDIDLLTQRLIFITDWVNRYPPICHMVIGYFGSSTGASAALNASVNFHEVKALISQGGRTDLADTSILEKIHIPTFFVVGGERSTDFIH